MPKIAVQIFLFLSLVAAQALALPASAQKTRPQAVPAAAATANAATARAALLRGVKNWGVQLKIVDLDAIVATPFDLLLIDHGYAASSTGKRAFEPAAVERLKVKPDGTRRIVLSYLSVGEAEDYRSYWNPAWSDPATKPVWLGPLNKNWPGNFIVRFWHPDWQRLIFGTPDAYLDRIMAQGFDGIYLDRVDVYQELRAERPGSGRDMIDFVTRLSAHARGINPNFIVVWQNAEELLVHDSLRRSIDAVGKEDLLYGEDHSQKPNKASTTRESIRFLNRMKRDGRPVFAIEYLDDPAKIVAARQRMAKLGFVPYFGSRKLDEIIVDPLARARSLAGKR